MFNNKSKNKILAFIFFLASLFNLIDSILEFKKGNILSTLIKLLRSISMSLIGLLYLLPPNKTK